MIDTILTLKEQRVGYDVTTDEEKEELKEIAKKKAQIRKKNVEKFLEKYKTYPKGYVFRVLCMNNSFVAFEPKDIKAITKISGPIGLLLYLKLAINRDMGYTDKGDEKDVFADLNEYYMNGGFLCTLRTQGYVAKQLDTSQQNISNWFKKLESLKLIRKVGQEKFITHNEEYLAPVYALGELVDIDGFDEEVFYYEITK